MILHSQNNNRNKVWYTIKSYYEIDEKRWCNNVWVIQKKDKKSVWIVSDNSTLLRNWGRLCLATPLEEWILDRMYSSRMYFFKNILWQCNFLKNYFWYYLKLLLKSNFNECNCIWLIENVFFITLIF
jgi:hypothetical protein